jgi:hypothetical protein
VLGRSSSNFVINLFIFPEIYGNLEVFMLFPLPNVLKLLQIFKKLFLNTGRFLNTFTLYEKLKTMTSAADDKFQSRKTTNLIFILIKGPNIVGPVN